MIGLRVQVLLIRRFSRLTFLRHVTWRTAKPVTGLNPWAVRTHPIWGSLALGFQRAPEADTLPLSWSVFPARFKSSKTSKKGSKNKGQEEEDDDLSPEDSDDEDELSDEPGLPKDYKDQERSVQSFRYDLIIRAGLDMARNKVEDAFYDNKLRLNGQQLIKKSKTVRVGDTLDLVLEEDRETDTVTLMRVIFKKVVGETQTSERYRVVLRRWKHLKLSKREAYRP